jgi:hypothetical protein
VVAAALVFVLPSSALARRTLGLSAGSFKFNVAAGDTVGGQVVVINEGDEPLKVMVYASDQVVDNKGNITYVTPSREDLASFANPSSWTRITMPANSKSLGNIPYLELKPGQRVPVKFSFTVPAGVAPGDQNVIIFFESFEMPKAGQGAQTTVSGRLGARTQLRVEGTVVEKLEVRPFTVPAFVIGGSVPYSFLVRNLGNVDQRVGARALLLDRNRNEVAKQIAIDGRTVFAGKNLEATGTLVAEKMPIGRFTVRLDLSKVDDLGNAVNAGKDTITDIRDVWLVPLWLLILVGVLLALALVRLIWWIAARSTRNKRSRGRSLREGRGSGRGRGNDLSESGDWADDNSGAEADDYDE